MTSDPRGSRRPGRHRLRFALTALSALFVVGACVARPGATVGPTDGASSGPASTAAGSVTGDSCPGMNVSAEYCRRLAAWFRSEAHLSADSPAALRLEELPTPTCQTDDGRDTACVWGNGAPRPFRGTAPSGATYEATLHCGVGAPAVCFDQPPLQAMDLGAQGYWDTPCTGEAPEGCASPVVPDPDAVRQARPLRIATFELPVGPVGHHEVEIGRAGIPNGVVSKATFALADSSQIQRGFVINPTYISMKLVSTDPSRPPFTNVHERPLVPGVEEVRVLLVYDVVETSPSAVVDIVGVDVE